MACLAVLSGQLAVKLSEQANLYFKINTTQLNKRRPGKGFSYTDWQGARLGTMNDLHKHPKLIISACVQHKARIPLLYYLYD